MVDGLPEPPADAFEKIDTGDDLAFYAPARLLEHIDEGAVEALMAYYRETLPPGGVLLDLMSSWVSHLPSEAAFREVVGHGMNAEELAAKTKRPLRRERRACVSTTCVATSSEVFGQDASSR